MFEVLTNNRCFRECFPDCEFDLLTRTEFGITVYLQAPAKWIRQVPGCQSHIDKWLACMAEMNVPLTMGIETASGPGTVADVLHESQMRFELSAEIEWTTVATARYFPSPDGWTNRFGTRFTFDMLAQHMLAAPRHRGSCFGIHKLFALVNLLRVHEQVPVLSERIARAVRDHLREVAHDLQRFQHDNGSWTARWSPVEADSDPRDDRQAAAEAFRSTGHHLEWIALAPPDLRPPDVCVARAIRYLLRTIPTLEGSFLLTQFANLSHCARALVLLKGCDPSDYLRPVGVGSSKAATGPSPATLPAHRSSDSPGASTR
jgi:hypothetical protein